jgi:hypothetical protein
MHSIVENLGGISQTFFSFGFPLTVLLEGVMTWTTPLCCDCVAPKALGIDRPWLHWVVCVPIFALQGTLFDVGNHTFLYFSSNQLWFWIFL